MARASASPAKRRALKIRSGDQVTVIAGKDRGKSGRVLRVEPAKRRVYVEGLNMVKRHMKPTAVRDTTRGQSIGGGSGPEGPIPVSSRVLRAPQGRPARARG